MPPTPRLALIGDYNEHTLAHQAINQTLVLARQLFPSLHTQWIASMEIEKMSDAQILAYQGVWCTPGSPYESTEGVIRAIQLVREQKIPFFGSCGGFQHAILEYARHVLAIGEADHYELNPEARVHVIVPLACSLVEKRDVVLIKPGSRLAQICGTDQLYEGYHCSYGVDEGYREALEQHGLSISAVDAQGNARAFEAREHPFFFGTLFQPERASLGGEIHPLVHAFLRLVSGDKIGFDGDVDTSLSVL